MRVLEFDNEFSPQELAQAVLDAGFPKSMTLEQIAGGQSPDEADAFCTLGCDIDEDDALDQISDTMIVQAAADIKAGAGDEHLIEDAIRSVRRGDIAVARALFPRFMEGADLSAVERALHS